MLTMTWILADVTLLFRRPIVMKTSSLKNVPSDQKAICVTAHYSKTNGHCSEGLLL